MSQLDDPCCLIADRVAHPEAGPATRRCRAS